MLGSGCAGEVRRVLCNGRFLARKQTKIDPRVEWELHESLEEVKVVKRLSHQHIAQLCGVYTLGTSLYALYYPVAEMSLGDYLALDRTRDPTWVNTIIGGMGCLSSALKYSHEMGIKHKDIHKYNVLVLGGVMILCDWGASSDSSAHFGSNRSRATQPGSSVQHQIESGRADDVFMLGHVLELMFAHVVVDRSTRNTQLPSKEEILRNLTPESKVLSKQHFACLFKVMKTSNVSQRPTARIVAEYLRGGRFDWGFRFSDGESRGEVVCGTCGECCR